MTFDNPWYNPYSGSQLKQYTGCVHICDKHGHSFYKTQAGNVLAVKDGVPVSECVTVAGACRHLKLGVPACPTNTSQST